MAGFVSQKVAEWTDTSMATESVVDPVHCVHRPRESFKVFPTTNFGERPSYDEEQNSLMRQK